MSRYKVKFSNNVTIFETYPNTRDSYETEPNFYNRLMIFFEPWYIEQDLDREKLYLKKYIHDKITEYNTIRNYLPQLDTL